MKELPGKLESDEGLAGAGRQCEEYPVTPVSYRRQHPFNGDVLVVATLKVAATVLERHGSEAVTPGVLSGKGAGP
ncbi:MAG: hypothetical protein ACD_55C00085G0002 [uncultured bacterium]|nr:MAG: hypothetical protein ACD_55C00085G0002 [uncultured bacterium]